MASSDTFHTLHAIVATLTDQREELVGLQALNMINDTEFAKIEVVKIMLTENINTLEQISQRHLLEED